MNYYHIFRLNRPSLILHKILWSKNNGCDLTHTNNLVVGVPASDYRARLPSCSRLVHLPNKYLDGSPGKDKTNRSFLN